MDLSDDFVHLSLESLDSLASDNISDDYSYAGFTVDSRITDALAETEDPHATAKTAAGAGQDVTVERFFEECFDTGIDVFSESSFEKGDFIGAGATMEVYKSDWKERSQKVALKYDSPSFRARNTD
jgi:hypothetical protein